MKNRNFQEFVEEEKPKIIAVAILLFATIVYPRYFFSIYDYVRSIDFIENIFFWNVLILLSAMFVLLAFLIYFCWDYFSEDDFSDIADHPIVSYYTKNEFFDKSHKAEILSSFSLSILFEEIIFRHFLLGIILSSQSFAVPETFDVIPVSENMFAILLSALIFSIYHIHMYFKTESKEVAIYFMIASFLLGILLGIVFIYCGTFICILLHWITAYTNYRLIAYYRKLKMNKSSSRVSRFKNLGRN